MQGTTGALKREHSSVFMLHVRHRTQTAVWVGKKTQSLLPNWPTKLLCKGPQLIHTPHGTIYKGAEGTFVGAQESRGLFKENVHLEAEERSTLGFLTKQV